MPVARIPGEPGDEGGSGRDYLAHHKGADEIPLSQFNSGGSTGHVEYDRSKVGSDEEAGAGGNMEIEEQVQVEDREATKEQGTRVATRAGVPVQGSEAESGRSVTARGDQIEGFHLPKLGEDLEHTTPRTPSDQNEEYGVQFKTPGPLTEANKDKDDEDDEEQTSLTAGAGAGEDISKEEDTEGTGPKDRKGKTRLGDTMMTMIGDTAGACAGEAVAADTTAENEIMMRREKTDAVAPTAAVGGDGSRRDHFGRGQWRG